MFIEIHSNYIEDVDEAVRRCLREDPSLQGKLITVDLVEEEDKPSSETIEEPPLNSFTPLRKFIAGLHKTTKAYSIGYYNGKPAAHTKNQIYGQEFVWVVGNRGRVEPKPYDKEYKRLPPRVGSPIRLPSGKRKIYISLSEERIVHALPKNTHRKLLPYLIEERSARSLSLYWSYLSENRWEDAAC